MLASNDVTKCEILKKQTSSQQEIPITEVNEIGPTAQDTLARQRRGAISESPPSPTPAQQVLNDNGIGTANLAHTTSKGSDRALPRNRWDLLIGKIDSQQSNTNSNTGLSKALKKEIRNGGIPTVHRRKVWLFVTHAQTLMTSGTYNDLTAKDKSTSPWITQIEKDLKRSLPALLNTPEAYEKLCRVLVAFSFYNPTIGYCQGLNFICAALLSSEEETFWVTVLLIDRHMTNYFTQSMVGVKTDVRVFRDLLTQRESALAAHLSRLGVAVETVVLKWFLCLFINCLPFDSALQFLDSYLLEGFKALLRVSLALFKLEAQRLLSYREFEDAFLAIRELPSGPTPMPTLFRSSSDRNFIGSITRSAIGKWRETASKAVRKEKQNLSRGPNDAFAPDVELKASVIRVFGDY